MSVIEQERKIIDLISMAKKSDKAAKRRRICLNIVGYSAIAAVAFFAGICTIITTRNSQKKNMEVHAYARNKTNITLPDGTKVVLKSSSTLEYDINAFAEGIREVNLDGEAFFDVTKISGNKFVWVVISQIGAEITNHAISDRMVIAEHIAGGVLNDLQELFRFLLCYITRLR